jgi:heptosyltransferase-3
MPGSSPSVLIIRLDAIGDALALTPMLAALRARDIDVDVVLRPGNARIFSTRAARRIVVAEKLEQRSGTPPNLAEIERLGADLRERRYTHVLVATEDPSGYRLARATGAPVRIGFTNLFGKPLKSLWSRRFLTHRVYRSAGLDRRAPHECEVLFRLAAPLVDGDAPTREVARLRPLVIESEPANARDDGRVTLQITDKWERLGIARTGVVHAIERLTAFGDLRLIAARGEGAYADDIATATGLPIERFDALEEWKEAIASAPAIVAPDSGALHVAGMTGTPIVAVFPPSKDFALQTARWAPWAAPHRIVRAGEGWPMQAADALAQLL